MFGKIYGRYFLGQYLGLIHDDEVGIFLGTAHPAKFRETVENVLGQPIALPDELVAVADKESLSVPLSDDYEQLKAHLFATLKK